MKLPSFAASLFTVAVLGAGFFVFSPTFIAVAQTNTNDAAAPADPPPHGPPSPPGGHNPAIDAALADCAQSLGAGREQLPDMAKMDACMRAKGFQKPKGPPPGGPNDGKGPPPQSGSVR